jgi:hypothetical protein
LPSILCLAPNEPPDVKFFDPPDFALEVLREHVEKSPPSVVEVLVGCAKFFEGAEAHQNGLAVSIFVFCRFEPFLAVGICEKGQEVVMTHMEE